MTNVLEYKPTALIIGNSRAEIGFDPEHPIWAQQSLRAYNLAVPGSGIQDSARQIRQLKNRLHPEVIVIGLDFLDFLVNPENQAMVSSQHEEIETWDRMRLAFSSLFSIQALADSFRTLSIQRNKSPESITSKGFNPLLDYGPIARNEGYYSMFRQRAQNNAQRFARIPKGLFIGNSKSSSDWDALTAILDDTLWGGGSVKIVIYPYHAQLLAMFEQYQLWTVFEAWKEHLVKVVNTAQDKNPGSIDLWDFSGFSDYQCEAIPHKGDKRSVVHWYWEAGHFKKELGDIILSRIFKKDENPGSTPEQVFGMRLTPLNLAANNARVQHERDNCFSQNPEILQEVMDIASQTKSAIAP